MSVGFQLLRSEDTAGLPNWLTTAILPPGSGSWNGRTDRTRHSSARSAAPHTQGLRVLSVTAWSVAAREPPYLRGSFAAEVPVDPAIYTFCEERASSWYVSWTSVGM